MAQKNSFSNNTDHIIIIIIIIVISCSLNVCPWKVHKNSSSVNDTFICFNNVSVALMQLLHNS
jgi:hypothetical protein